MCYNKVIRWYQIRKCKKQFSGLEPRMKKLFKAMKIDPESKIKRGDFDHREAL